MSLGMSAGGPTPIRGLGEAACFHVWIFTAHHPKRFCPSGSHIPVFCPDQWRYDRAVFSIGRKIVLVSEELKFIRIFAWDQPPPSESF